MAFDPDRYHRHSIRIQGYDYARAGVYYVTLVTEGRIALFGEVVEGAFQGNEAAGALRETLEQLPRHYPHVAVEAYVIMPNHLHALLVLRPDDAAGARHGLQEVVRALKSFSARRINALRDAAGSTVWQRNYWERVIRDERELQRAWEYIERNPSQWQNDRENPAGVAGAGADVGACAAAGA
ncbi:MAG: REP-associated tyrosine transposase [Anaerolineae bacterium]